jgi:protein kinase-like protein
VGLVDRLQPGDPGQIGPFRLLGRLGAALAEGLAAIHDCGLIHRDLKPGNVIMADDGPRIIDFGIAKGADATALTGSSAVIGTLRYMSPEQLNGNELTPQSDVFALGTVLAFAATGHDPFEAPTIPAIITRILTDPPDLDPLTGDLRGIVGGCLAKDPGSRPSPGNLLARFGRPAPHDPAVTSAPAPVPAAGPPAADRPVTQAAWPADADVTHGTVTVTSAPAGGPPAPAARSAGDVSAGSEASRAGKPTARPAPPKSIVHAVRIMYAGAALPVILGVVALLIALARK